MKKLLTTLLVLLAISSQAQTPAGFQWIQHHGDFIDFDPEIARDIAVDKNGNVYVAGQVNDLFVRDSMGNTIRMQSNPNLDSLENNGGVDVWLAKYSSTGELLWHRYAGGGNDERYFDMIADENGNCYVSGEIRSTNQRGLFSFNKTPLTTAQEGAFVAKVNAAGDLVWHKTFDGGNTSTVPYNALPLNLSISETEVSCFFRGGGTLEYLVIRNYLDKTL